MRFSVRHETLYRYSVPVTFAPHVLRLHPRRERARVLSQSLAVDPAPATMNTRLDAFDNAITEVTFSGAGASALRVVSALEVETLPADALARARNVALLPLPWAHPAHSGDALAPYRGSAIAPPVRAFADALRAEERGDPLRFLERLTRELCERTERGIRVEGAAQPPEVTLERRTGACRDLAVLFLAVCRSQGIAGRFVSGYQAQAQTPDGNRYLHGWAEVYVDGAGWCGWDPMHGIAVGEGHVALCAAPDQPATMPVEGGFYANGVTSTLDWSLRIATS
jgi:transglutaminase-like putative cysteine protease